jgi:hypothetical protein
MFVVEIGAFEDQGAHWLVPFEDVNRYQFARDCARASDVAIRHYSEAVERFNRPLVIEPCASARAATTQRIMRQKLEADEWLDRHGIERFDPSGAIAARAGDAAMQRLLNAYLEQQDLAAMDSEFAETFVSNPRSGETVKGHAIVLADLGLVRFEGKIVRSPSVFQGPWNKERRAAHVIARLAFAQALWRRSAKQPVLYRGVGPNPTGLAYQPLSFISATFSHEVAAAHEPVSLLEQRLPPERVLMTFLETEAMNRQFKEAEAVLLAAPSDPGIIPWG